MSKNYEKSMINVGLMSEGFSACISTILCSKNISKKEIISCLIHLALIGLGYKNLNSIEENFYKQEGKIPRILFGIGLGLTS